MEKKQMYVNETKLSELFDIPVQTLRNDRHHGRGINYSKIGRSVRYSLTEAIQYMEQRKIKTEPK